MTDKVYSTTEVCAKLGICYATLNRWYRCKKQFPNDKFSRMIPKFTENSRAEGRKWTLENINQLKQCKKLIKKGRNGNGKLTYIYQQKAYKKEGK